MEIKGIEKRKDNVVNKSFKRKIKLMENRKQ